MTMIITQEILDAFRLWEPPFSDVTKWPDNVLTRAFSEAFPECGGSGWGAFDVTDWQNFKLRGVFNFAAHWMSVKYNTGQGATDPSVSNASARLNVAAKSVRDESVTYRVGGIQSTQNDWLSLTNYGVQFLRQRDKVGMGAIAL
jgi:hypothetical protein